MSNAKIFPKIYWKPKNSPKMWKGQGVQSTNSLLLGGRCFSPQKSSKIWEKFPSSFFFTPAHYSTTPWPPLPRCISSPLPKIIDRSETPTFGKWKIVVEDAVDKIKKNHFKKVVLARQTTLTCNGNIDPEQIFKLLYRIGENTSLFFLQMDENTTFLGATPEKLFHRKESNIVTEALAGTTLQSQQWTPKEFSEIQIVQDFLNEKFHSLCSEFHAHPIQELPFHHLYHLHQVMEGNLKRKLSDHDLITQLHPTPALGGFPQQEALDYILEKEDFARGWYGSPFGMITKEESFIAVAIRSALIEGSKIHLFSGAGIVKDSNPEQEWEELNQKISFYVNLFSSV